MKLELGQVVYHEKLYWGKEPMKVVGIREKEVELEGDYSGGTHAVCQKDWLPIEGILLSKSETMTTEQNEIKSAEWRKKNLSKNSFLDNISVSVAVEKHTCKTCRFAIGGKYGNCWVGTYYAEQGKDRFCYEGELWEATER